MQWPTLLTCLFIASKQKTCAADDKVQNKTLFGAATFEKIVSSHKMSVVMFFNSYMYVHFAIM